MRFFRNVAREYKEAFSLFTPNARLFLLGNVLLGIGANLVQLLLNLYLKKLEFGESTIGTILAVRAFGSFLVALPASIVVARLNSRWLLASTAILTAIAYASVGLSSGLYPIIAGVFFSGAFASLYQVAAGPFFMRNSGEKERVHLFSLNGAIGMGTGVIGSLAGGFFKDIIFASSGNEIYAYRMALVLGACFVLAALVPFLAIRDSHAAAAARKEKVALGKVDIALFIKILLPGFFVGMGAGLTIPYLNLYFKNEFLMPDSGIALVFAAGQVVTFAGMMSGPALAKRLGKRRAIFLTQAVSVPFILVLAYLRWMPLVILAFLARQSLMNMSTPIADNFALERVPHNQQHFMNALRMLNWTGSWMVSTKLSGAIIAKSGFAPSFTLTAFLYALSSVLFWLFFLRKGACPPQAKAQSAA